VILAIDTATRSISIALAEEGRALAEAVWQSENNHTTELAPAVERMLIESGVAVKALTAIAVAIGPGSFTGVRIGLGFAKGLALARGDLPLVGVRTLDIAVRALPIDEGEAVAVIQAGRGRVVWARYSARAGRWESANDGVVGSWEDVSRSATGSVVVGEIDSRGMDVLQGAGVRVASADQNVRRASRLAEMAWERWRRGEVDSAAALMPVYAHQPTSGET